MPIHWFKWRVKRSKQISVFLLQVKIAVLTTDQLQETVAPRPYHKAGHQPLGIGRKEMRRRSAINCKTVTMSY